MTSEVTNPTALVREPSPELADGLVTHVERTAVDVDLAWTQWQAYVDTLAAQGWRTVHVEPEPGSPDSVFVEDAVVVHRQTAVVTRPGADSRKPETAGAERAVRELGYHVVRIEAPGTLDGGDVLKIGDTVYVGVGGRTNGAAVRQLRESLRPAGAEVVPVPLTRVLHLKSAVTALPDGTVIGHLPLVDHPTVFPRFLPVPEEAGSHVVLLGGDRLLMAADAPRSAELFACLGWQPVVVDISEFEKLEGCVTCLSVRLRELPG